MQQTLEDAPALVGDHGGKLRTSMAAMRLSFTWFGTRKSLSSEQKAQAADTFHAEGKYISAGKKLIDTGDASFRAVTSVRTQATAYFKGTTLPFPEPGIRLVPQAALDQIGSRMQSFQDELAEAGIMPVLVGEADVEGLTVTRRSNWSDLARRGVAK